MAGMRRKRRMVSEINVVPYIDVMLVLLVIFMITAPLLMRGVEVDLPRAEAEPMSPEQLEQSQPVVVSVDAEGRLYLNIADDPQSPMASDRVRDRVSAALDDQPGRPVMVKGDAAVDYGRVVSAMVLLQQAGAASVGLITASPEQEESG